MIKDLKKLLKVRDSDPLPLRIINVIYVNSLEGKKTSLEDLNNQFQNQSIEMALTGLIKSNHIIKEQNNFILVEEQIRKDFEDKPKFDDRVQGKEREEFGLPKDAVILGYTNFVLFETKDGKLDFKLNGGGYWPDEMKLHMNKPLIKVLRNFHYEYYKIRHVVFGDSIRIKQFDYEL